MARAAEKLYKHVDHLELYPGMMAEEAKPSMDGSGLAPGVRLLVQRRFLSRPRADRRPCLTRLAVHHLARDPL